ncbi:hypothetical protein [Microlunatus antarcticus]|uniref:Uncharacterized protein n=1 Tax=Microlunatus antarcticus TaxID=53388 RepID=A0A7W5JY02_9ACTN|nr:hypothetical protein [Microlunatus antarcticus]MBB3328393.1 hypothetical protein [Microlunatus antarcticus]
MASKDDLLEWHWRSDRPAGARGSGPTRPVGTEQFPSQGEAESWLGEVYPDLLASGVHAVSLYDGDRFVYGPMSLEPDPG